MWTSDIYPVEHKETSKELCLQYSFALIEKYAAFVQQKPTLPLSCFVDTRKGRSNGLYDPEMVTK